MQKTVSLCFAVMLLLNIATAQERGFAYRWPVKPGTPEWKALKTHHDMLAVLQIPTDVLSGMSTTDLVETCLDYPLFPDIWAFNSYQEGIDKAVAGFNGFRELMMRRQAGRELLKRYQEINLSDLDKKKTDVEQWEFKMHVCKLEALLSQHAILHGMTKSDRLSLLRHSLAKNKAIQESGKYSFYSYESNSFLALKILSVESAQILNDKLRESKDIAQFLKQGTGISAKTINEIVELSNSFLSNSK